jgi:ABC-type transport system involved in multi-copper enzyme maturation permease subunit
MAVALLNWMKDSVGVYIGNATTMRDFRAQLRGNKSLFLWGAYLGLLVLVTAIAYSTVAENSGSVSSIQDALAGFYETVVGLLGGLIFLLAPSLTATTVVMERKRKSLDLVFSAPVSPKYYLVGKMLSSMRYTWMLLILALPVASVGVVMGGATWGDVLAAYVMLASIALVVTAFGLLMSVVAPTVVSAIVWTYLFGGLYLLVTSGIAEVSRFSGRGMQDLEANWSAGISPFTVAFAAPTHTTIYGIEVPNWILVLAYSLFLSKILVLGAASAMSGYGAKETKSLRLHLIVAVSLAAALITSTFAMIGMGSPAVSMEGLARAVATIMVFLALGIPAAACYSYDADRRNRPDGWFRPARMLLGTPSGALPFFIVAGLCVAAAMAFAYWRASGFAPTRFLLEATFWGLSYLFFWWSVARVISSYAKTLNVARMLTIISFIVVVALPAPAFAILNSMSGSYSRSVDESIFVLHILYPIFADKDVSGPMVAYGIGLTLIGVLLTVWALSNQVAAERRRKVFDHENVG